MDGWDVLWGCLDGETGDGWLVFRIRTNAFVRWRVSIHSKIRLLPSREEGESSFSAIMFQAKCLVKK